LFSAPALGPAKSVQAKAPKNGGVTKEAITSARIGFFHGKSVRVTSQASNAPTATAITPTQKEITTVFQIAFKKAAFVKTSRYRPRLKPVSSHKLARKIDPRGKTIRNTSNSAAAIHTGKVVSHRCRKAQLAAGARPTASVLEAGMDFMDERCLLGAENFDEAFFDFRVALLELLRVSG
jgi:hypothetical protein